MSATCESCTFYDHKNSNTSNAPLADDGLCRFNPPVSQPVPDAHGLWPVVTKSDWCGHFSTQSAVAR